MFYPAKFAGGGQREKGKSLMLFKYIIALGNFGDYLCNVNYIVGNCLKSMCF